MDREYLENYKQKELDNCEKLRVSRIEEGSFDFKEDKYPPRERFFNLQKPVALTTLEAPK